MKILFNLSILLTLCLFCTIPPSFNTSNNSKNNDETCLEKISPKNLPSLEIDSIRVARMQLDSILSIFRDTSKSYILRKTGTIAGKRLGPDIMKTVMENLAALRYRYNKRLTERSPFAGKITVMFIVNEAGKVIDLRSIYSTIDDNKFQCMVLEKIRTWQFPIIQSESDTSVSVYPFVFSQ